MSQESVIDRALDEMHLAFGEMPDLESALRGVTSTAVALVPGCEAASITSVRADLLVSLAASDVAAEAFDLAQSADGGPSLEAIRSGQIVVSDLATHPEAWPHLVSVADQTGLSGVCAVPLSAGDALIGALTIYCRSIRAADTETRLVADALAARVATSVHAARLYFDVKTLADQLQQALVSRATIEQAKGIIMSQNHCDADTAFRILTKASQNRNTKLRDLAQEIVERAAIPVPQT